MKQNEPIIEESFPKSFPVQKIQEHTKEKSEEIQDPYEELDEIHQLATSLRARYIPYKIIAQTIAKQCGKKYTESWLRSMFQQGGMCRDALDSVRAKLAVEREADLLEMNNKLKETAIDAIGLLADALLDDKISAGQKAIAWDILDRAGFPKTSKSEEKHEVTVNESKVFTDAIVMIASNLNQK